jgi:bacillithiol system protein YtxJ
MNSAWNILETHADLKAAFEESQVRPVLVFKHSTRCSISSMALNRLKGLGDDFLQNTPFYYLDLIAYRDLSSSIADQTGVRHESPQILIIDKGECRYHASHMEISAASIQSALA